MKWFLESAGVCLVVLALAGSELVACNPRGCKPTRPVPVRPVRPEIVVPPTPVNPGPGPEVNGTDPADGNEVVWDLPEAEKRRIREAVRFRETESAPQAVSRPVAATPQAPALSDRVARALAAHKTLTAQVARLMAKRNEIQRWDGPAQEKFRQAFGSTDEQVRQRVQQRIDQLIQEGTRVLASLAEEIRFEFYVARNKRQ